MFESKKVKKALNAAQMSVNGEYTEVEELLKRSIDIMDACERLRPSAIWQEDRRRIDAIHAAAYRIYNAADKLDSLAYAAVWRPTWTMRKNKLKAWIRRHSDVICSVFGVLVAAAAYIAAVYVEWLP